MNNENKELINLLEKRLEIIIRLNDYLVNGLKNGRYYIEIENDYNFKFFSTDLENLNTKIKILINKSNEYLFEEEFQKIMDKIESFSKVNENDENNESEDIQ